MRRIPSCSWIEKLGKALIRSIIAGILTLVVVQGVLFYRHLDLSNQINQVVEIEAVKFYKNYPESRVTPVPIENLPWLKIRLVNFSSLQKANLLIDGQKAADFRDKEVTVRVLPGERLEIDGSYYQHTLVFQIVGASSNVIAPLSEKEIIVNGGKVFLGEVKIKSKENS